MVSLNDTLINALATALRPTPTPAAAPRAPASNSREQDYRRGRRAILNLIPDNDALMDLIRQARAALERGIFWDRGSIIDLIL
jgi:hypothetical protein